MDHTRDNPLKRFKAFWLANILVLSFGVALILLRPLTHMDSDTAMDVTGQARLEIKKEVDRGQSEALDSDALAKAVSEQLKTFGQNTAAKGAMPLPSAAPAPVKKEAPGPEGETKEALAPTE